MRVSEIRVKRIRVNQVLGVLSCGFNVTSELHNYVGTAQVWDPCFGELH